MYMMKWFGFFLLNYIFIPWQFVKKKKKNQKTPKTLIELITKAQQSYNTD